MTKIPPNHQLPNIHKPSQRREVLFLFCWAGAFLCAGWLFFAVLEDVASNDLLVVFDKAVHEAFLTTRTLAGNHIMVAVTELGDTAVVFSVATVICLLFLFERKWRSAGYWVASIGFAAALNTSIKMAVHRSRPSDLFYTGPSEFSFPSGHTTANAVMYGFFAFLIARQLRPSARKWVAIAALSMISLIAVSRLYLGAHWFSDVVASLSLASAWLIVVCMSYRSRAGEVNLRRLCVVAGTALFVFGSVNISIHHDVDFQRYGLDGKS